MSVVQDIRRELFGKEDYRPLVRFYMHATPDQEATERDGRPRFKEVVYVKFKPTHPDLTVRDVVSFRAKDEHKLEYAREWEIFQKEQKEISEFNPPLQAVPGMRISAWHECQALGIHDCAALAAYEGDLGEFDYLREVAKRVQEVASEARDLRARREAVREDHDRQQQYSSPVPGTVTGGPDLRAEATGRTFKISDIAKGGQEFFPVERPKDVRFQKKESHEKTGDQENGIQTFRYSFQI